MENTMYKLISNLSLIITFATCHAGSSEINWVTGNDGSWFDSNNWVELEVPFDGVEVRFGVGDNDNSLDAVNIDNLSNGVNLPNSTLRLERKVTFSDEGALGNPQQADDGMIFDVMAINGAGGIGVTFDVPVTADIMTSNRHGGVFNREITVNSILAESRHQDKWQINAGATKPISYVLIDENRDEDGGTVDGFFKINSDLIIDQLDFVWGSLQIGSEVDVVIDVLNVSVFSNQEENNNISPIVIAANSTVFVSSLKLLDVANNDVTFVSNGSYGSEDNTETDFTTPLIVGEGVLVVCRLPIFVDGFEAEPAIEQCIN